jgi:hypothetical protein
MGLNKPRPMATCCVCGQPIMATQPAVMVAHEWYCLKCVPPIHPMHARDADILTRYLVWSLVVALVVCLCLWVLR